MFRVCSFFCIISATIIAALAQNQSFTKNNLVEPQELILLAETLAKGSTEQKRNALARIRNIETAEASRIAVVALKDDSEIVRATAAASVVFLEPNEAAPYLLPLLADKQALVRREAAYALGKIRNPNTINALLQLSQKDKVLEVRNAAIVALGEIGDVSAVAELIKILQRKPKDNEEFARRSAARSIGQIAQIIQTSKTIVLTPENFLPEALKPIDQPKYSILTDTFPVFRLATDRLIEILRDAREAADVQREAAFALGAIGDELAIAVLQSKTDDADYYLAEMSREALRKIAVANRR